MLFCLPDVASRNMIIFALTASLCLQASAQDRPNILWVTSEDNGPQLGCYGDQYADTPNIDALASKSLLYRMCWSNAPVCAPARTTLISGMYATSLGGHNMRSGVQLPAKLKLYPEVLREAGYYCTNNSKKDYNFAAEDGGWNESSRKAHWRNRPDPNTPFFAIFNFTVSHESKIRTRPHQLVHDPAKAPLPAYHPDTPEVRQDWAQYYDKMTEMDRQVGEILNQLQQDGLADSTIVFYYGDHGSGMPRSKRWPFNSGLQVPLLLHVPEKFRDLAPSDYRAGSETDRLAAFVDLGPTAISLAGVKPPTNMQGSPLAGPYAGNSKQFLFGFRGRMDERIDMVRSCTDGRYVYMRHFYPDRPYLKHVEYMFQTPSTRVWKQLFDQGSLNEAQAKFWQPKPVEELFDLHSDPDEVNNLAGQAEQAERLAVMREAVKQWMVKTRDLGLLPEAEMHRLCGGNPPRSQALKKTKFVQRLADTAFAAMDPNGATIQQLIEWTGDPDSGIRFWAVRGLAIRDSKSQQRNSALRNSMDDKSPSVAIAACDGLLDSAWRTEAVEQLIRTADVEKSGNFAAIAALNVLDMNANLNAAEKAAIAKLPQKVTNPPARMGGYVPKLINHATQ
ncbi:MAG: sulfatase [Rubripirellula sp.]|nr:sulfatase [Rubripirellula sp.]